MLQCRHKEEVNQAKKGKRGQTKDLSDEAHGSKKETVRVSEK